MKKLLFILVCAIFAVSASADVSTVYVNPIQNHSGVSSVIAKRLYKKALLGLTKAKTIAIVSGPKNVSPGSDEAQTYDYIMTIDITEATVTEAGSIGNIIGEISGIFGGSSQKKRDPDWEGKFTTDVIIVDAKTGNQVYKTTLEPMAINKDKDLAIFNATNNFDYDLTDMTDDVFRVCGEIDEATEVDKKNIVKKVRVRVGSKNGARKDQAFELYKVVGNDQELIGAAKCEQVLNTHESILSITGKKDDAKLISELIQNRDGSYTIQAWSRSKSGLIHDYFQGVDKFFTQWFTKRVRPYYLDPFNRTSKPRIAFLAIEINDNSFSSQKDNFQNAVVEGMENVPTIQLVKAIYPNVDAARNDGIDGLIEISIDKIFKTKEKTEEGKINYQTKILYTITGIDVANNKWIDMKSFSDWGSSLESAAKANENALTLMDNRVQKYSEDLFPVAASIISPEEVKKNSVKKVRINVGTDMGAKKGMAFDIYEQQEEGGADSRYLLGEGKVEKDGLTTNEAILNVKGKNDGDKKLYELLQNLDGSTKIVLVSKATYNILERGTEFLNSNN